MEPILPEELRYIHDVMIEKYGNDYKRAFPYGWK